METVQSAIDKSIKTKDWEKHKTVEYDSLLGGGKIVEITVLRRIQE
jgi:hypothetical protein